MNPAEKPSRNVADTQAYSAFDHIFLKALRSISHVVGVNRLTQPFWGRWQASNIGADILVDFLGSIRHLDDWPDAAMRMAARENEALRALAPTLTTHETIERLRRLSYLCNLGQWGILPIDDRKRRVYTLARDSYVEAETVAFGDGYARFSVAFDGARYPANIHFPARRAGEKPGLIILVHGLDDCKEEHLATELALLETGCAVIGFDGPGQGEAFLLDGHLWTPRFAAIVPALIDRAESEGWIDAGRVGSVGFSIGSMWSLLAASADPRISAVYDLGAPINTRMFSRVPFLIKSKMCQITGARTRGEIEAVLARNAIDTPDILAGIRADVRIAHGQRDRVVALADKRWLFARLSEAPGRRATMTVFDDGDHCCTNHIPEIRADMIAFFRERLSAA